MNFQWTKSCSIGSKIVACKRSFKLPFDVSMTIVVLKIQKGPLGKHARRSPFLKKFWARVWLFIKTEMDSPIAALL